MKQENILLLVIISILSFTSCVDDVNVKHTFNIDTELVLFARICPQADTNYAYVYNSIPFFIGEDNPQTIKPISNAIVEISDDKVNWARFNYNTEREAFTLRKDVYTFEEGKTYHIRASSIEYETVTASCTVPYNRDVNLKLHQELTEEIYNEDIGSFERSYINTFTWTDFPGEENFYMLYTVYSRFSIDEYEEDGILYIDTTYYNRRFNWVSDMKTYEKIFTDKGADGDELSVSDTGYETEYSKIMDTVYVFMMDKGCYLYEQWIERYYGSIEMDLISIFEPVLVYSNIENGFGFFGAYNSKTYIVSKTMKP